MEMTIWFYGWVLGTVNGLLIARFIKLYELEKQKEQHHKAATK